MRKGIYSGVIALTALVLAVAIIATAGQRIAMQGDSIYGSSMMEVKMHWQNARYVLDKAASDAIADSVFGSGNCTYSTGAARTAVSTYFPQILNEMWEGECIVSAGPSLSGASGNITINATIKCGKDFGAESSVFYEKQVTFKKAVSSDSSGGSCLIDIEDMQSGVCEVDEILSGPNNLCSQ